jgi:hypothetical protein
MLKFEENLASRVSGALQPMLGVQVTVTASNGLLATLYADDESTVLGNPLTTDTNGYFGFKAANGEYTLTFSGAQIENSTRKVELYDADDDPPLTLAQAAVPTAASRIGFQQAGAETVARTVENKLQEMLSIKDCGAKGDGTDDRDAFLAADADAVGPVILPPGEYRVSSQPALSKPLLNFGATVTLDAGSWLPRFEHHMGLLYDFTKKVNTSGTYLDTPSSYTYLKGLGCSYAKLVNAAGYQQNFGSDSGGRTLIPIYYAEANHGGMGDVNAFQASINVTPHTNKDAVTKWVGQNSATGHSAQVSAGGAQVNLYGMEHHLYDEGFADVSALGIVLNFRRTGVDAKAYSTPWIGARFQAFGTTGADSAFQLAGDWKVGLDLSDADLTAAKCAIALKASDRVYWNVDPISTINDQWFAGDNGATLGDVYSVFESGLLKDIVGGISILQRSSTAVQVRPGVDSQFSTRIFGSAANPFAGIGQIGAISYFGAASQGTDNTTLALYVAQNGAEVNALVIPSTGDIQSAVGNCAVMTAGKGLRVKEGVNAKQGVATLSGGTITVPNVSVTANSRIFLTAQDNNTVGVPRVSARVAGTSFTITSSNATDSGVVAYEIFEPA